LQARAKAGSPSFRYPWRDVRPELERSTADKGSPYDGVLLEYVNPITGGAALPTVNCQIQSLHPGLATARHRSTASAVYYVVEGEGTTLAGDQEIEWSSRDAFVIPNWTWHRHINRSGSAAAMLFSVTDRALLTVLGLYREEPENSFQVMPLVMRPNRILK
jgi:gentisate 1,2-dioxygenase/1-hydroxy-2-naphthoate dioxygenase